MVSSKAQQRGGGGGITRLRKIGSVRSELVVSGSCAVGAWLSDMIITSNFFLVGADAGNLTLGGKSKKTGGWEFGHRRRAGKGLGSRASRMRGLSRRQRGGSGGFA